jgi:hypothetical protein
MSAVPGRARIREQVATRVGQTHHVVEIAMRQ